MVRNEWLTIFTTLGVWILVILSTVFTLRSGCQAQVTGVTTSGEVRPSAPVSREVITPTTATAPISGSMVYEHRHYWVGGPIEVRVENRGSSDVARPSAPTHATTVPAAQDAVAAQSSPGPAWRLGPGKVQKDFPGTTIDGRATLTLRKGGRVDLLGPHPTDANKLHVQYLPLGALPDATIELYIDRQDDAQCIQYMLLEP